MYFFVLAVWAWNIYLARIMYLSYYREEEHLEE